MCDCCDGSDELNNPYYTVECPNTCEVQLNLLRREALVLHRTIQSGLRTRTERIQSFQLHKQYEKRSYETLLEDQKQMNSMLVNMKALLEFEKIREEELRWTLLHDRIYHCAVGK